MACPGVDGFTQEDWGKLDKLVARFQEAKTSGTSEPKARPDVPGAP
jgi:hypothetical protein